MKLEMNVVRFNNEDVIATSACTKTHTTIDFTLEKPDANNQSTWMLKVSGVDVGSQIKVDEKVYPVISSTGAVYLGKPKTLHLDKAVLDLNLMAFII